MKQRMTRLLESKVKKKKKYHRAKFAGALLLLLLETGSRRLGSHCHFMLDTTILLALDLPLDPGYVCCCCLSIKWNTMVPPLCL